MFWDVVCNYVLGKEGGRERGWQCERFLGIMGNGSGLERLGCCGSGQFDLSTEITGLRDMHSGD